MNLPFLRYLNPLFRKAPELEPIKLCGHLKIEHQVAGGPKRVVYNDKNYIVSVGITAARDLLMGPNGALEGGIFRMAIGDGGTEPGQLYTPKQPDATWDARDSLYYEVYRKDVSVFSTPTYNSIRFVGTFNSIDVDDTVTSYSLSDKVINEAALIAGDGVLGGGDKQINATPPEPADSDEIMFSTRTFNSVPFDNGTDITLTVTWTISIVK